MTLELKFVDGPRRRWWHRWEVVEHHAIRPYEWPVSYHASRMAAAKAMIAVQLRRIEDGDDTIYITYRPIKAAMRGTR